MAAQLPALRIRMGAFVQFLRAAFGNQPDVLADFGLRPRKAATPLTVEQKAAAAAKRKATREARNTMGPVKKRTVKGTVTGVTITPIAPPGPIAQVTATPTAPIPGATTGGWHPAHRLTSGGHTTRERRRAFGMGDPPPSRFCGEERIAEGNCNRTQGVEARRAQRNPIIGLLPDASMDTRSRATRYTAASAQLPPRTDRFVAELETQTGSFRTPGTVQQGPSGACQASRDHSARLPARS